MFQVVNRFSSPCLAPALRIGNRSLRSKITVENFVFNNGKFNSANSGGETRNLSGTNDPIISEKSALAESELIKAITSKFQINQPGDWYRVKQSDLSAVGASLVWKSGGLPALASKAFPDFDFLPWRFSPVPPGYWNEKENQKKYLDWLGKELKLLKREDWYNVTNADFMRNDGAVLLMKHKNSASSVVMDIYSDFPFKPWLFKVSPRNYFKNEENQILYLNWLKNEKKIENFANLKCSDFIENGGSAFLNIYNFSIAKILENFNFENSEIRMRKVPIWEIEKQREFLVSLGEKMGIKKGEYEKWYSVKQKDIIKFGGEGLLKSQYGNSVTKMIINVFPEFNFVPWKFSKLPTWASRDKKLLERAVKEIENNLGLKEISDWNGVKKEEIINFESYKMIKANGGVVETLKSVYPEIPWDAKKMRFFGPQKD